MALRFFAGRTAEVEYYFQYQACSQQLAWRGVYVKEDYQTDTSYNNL